MQIFKIVFSFSSDKYPGMKLLDRMVVIFIRRTSILFSITTVSIYIPTNNIHGFPFSTSSPTLIFSMVTILTDMR